MKKFKNRKRFISATTTFLLLFAFYACHKEYIKDNSVTVSVFSLKLEDVITDYNQKAVFLNNLESDTMFSLIKNLNPKPVWTSSLRRKKGNLDFIETPLTLDKILLRENFDNVNHGNRRTPTANDIWQYLRLISLKNSAGQIESKYVILSPEANYKKNDEEAIQAMTFGRPLKDFTGRELCYNLDGSFYKGWEYDKGNIKAEIKASNIDRLSGLQTRELLYLDCSPIWQSVCSANYGCTYSIIGQDCVTITASGGSTTSSDPFSMYFGFTSGGSSSGGSSAFDGMPTAIVGKCVTPEIPLCPGSIIVNNLNGTAYINMKDVNI